MTRSTESRRDEALVRDPDALHSRSGEVTVALLVESGDCFSFSGPSGRIWELLEAPISPRQLAHQLVSEYDIGEEACLEQTLTYLDKLQAEGLVQRAGAG